MVMCLSKRRKSQNAFLQVEVKKTVGRCLVETKLLTHHYVTNCLPYCKNGVSTEYSSYITRTNLLISCSLVCLSPTILIFSNYLAICFLETEMKSICFAHKDRNQSYGGSFSRPSDWKCDTPAPATCAMLVACKCTMNGYAIHSCSNKITDSPSVQGSFQ